MEERKYWNASGPKAAEKLLLFQTYIPELANYPLESHSLCQTHYNQIVSSNLFFEHLSSLIQENQLGTNIDTQTTSYADLITEIERTKELFESAQRENIELCNRIKRNWQYLEEQANEAEELKKQLQDASEEANAFRYLYEDQYEKNKTLTEQWNSRFFTQQKRIDAIIEIANAERKALFDDVDLLIHTNNRLSLESLIKYNSREWLTSHNQVVVKFIETLVQNNQATNISSQEKLFKIVFAVDSIYGARHGKYVSEIQLAASAIKYSIARSMMVIDIDNHITSSGSYHRFQKWLEELSRHEEPLPEGLLFLAFDNEQRGQKNYLDQGFNTVIFYIVTSFVAFNMASQNKIQHTNLPWLYLSFSKSQYEEIFDVSPEMQKVINEELYAYLAEVLVLLSEEKLSSTNTIDSLVASMPINASRIKSCSGCNLQNIENRKRLCPRCGMQLPTLTKIQKEKTVDVEKNTIDYLTNPLTFKHYRISNEQITTRVPKISLTQQVADLGVNVPEIYISDPVNINPNSVANVEKILSHIELKEKFPWLVLILGQLHEEMNMLRAYVELNWEIDLKRFAISQGYRTENQLAYFKKCADYHKSWDSICNIYRQAMAMELLWPYVKDHLEPSVEEYLVWVKEQQDSLYQIKYEQSARRHPIYRLIEVADEVQLMQLYPEIRDIVEKNCVVSRSGIYEQHQGLDAIIEELRNNLFQVIRYNDYQPSGPRTRPESTMECQRFRTLLRNFEFVDPTNLKPCQSLGGDCELNENLKNFTHFAKDARRKFIIETFINKNNSFLFRPISITKEEARAQESEENLTKPEILAELSEILQEIKSLLSSDNEVDNEDNEVDNEDISEGSETIQQE
ncbi:hypothetical protein F8M41_025984 [Gigaspora margarita]|uniref:Uncharacterized protein n=1 Tax=Gigaspora margarita TaxID=4874 RepID=A0A8H3XHK3_GIGMA|nr:hypothetical protein F8M41_025984 [Gigaspora margarita]